MGRRLGRRQDASAPSAGGRGARPGVGRASAPARVPAYRRAAEGAGMLGRVLKNRYKLIDERGSGSMATVYIGRDLETNRLYAVKVLSRQAAAESELVERFQREFELLTRLSGPHVVSPVDFGEDRGNLFIVMDYVDGHNLKHAVLTGGAFAPGRAIDATEQACAGVATAAERGIVHRDIKPQNLLLSVE